MLFPTMAAFSFPPTVPQGAASPTLSLTLVFSFVFWRVAILQGVSWSRVVVLVCISLTTSFLSCAGGPFVCHLWGNVQSSPLPVRHLIVSVSFVVE